MTVARLGQVGQEAQARLNRGEGFEIAFEGEGLLLKEAALPFTPSVHCQNVLGLLHKTLIQLIASDLRSRPLHERETLQRVIEFCSDYFKRLPGLGAAGSEYLQRVEFLKTKLLQVKCGGRLPQDPFAKASNFRAFVEHNHLENKLLNLHMQLAWGGKDPLLPIASLNKAVSWGELKLQDSPLGGYDFSYNGRLLFSTDANYVLRPDYCFTHEGILHYNPKDPTRIIAYDRQNPAEWNHKHILEIWTVLVDKTGEKIQHCIGDHSMMVLKNGDTGDCFSIGQFGFADEELTCGDYLSIFGHKRGGLETPDRYIFLPRNSQNFHKVQKELTRAQYETVFARWQRDKANPNHVASAANSNCTSYTVRTFNETVGPELGITLNARMSVASFFIRQIFPKWIQNILLNGWKSTIGQLPDWAQKAIYFFPLFYIPQLLVSLFCKCTSFGSFDGETDFAWEDIFFFPWNIGTHHPVALREQLIALETE